MFYRTGAGKAKVVTTEGQENSEWNMRKRDIKHTPKLMFSMAHWEAAATFKDLFKPQWCGSICSTQWVVLIFLAGGSCETASGDSHPGELAWAAFLLSKLVLVLFIGKLEVIKGILGNTESALHCRWEKRWEQWQDVASLALYTSF